MLNAGMKRNSFEQDGCESESPELDRFVSSQSMAGDQECEERLNLESDSSSEDAAKTAKEQSFVDR